MIRQALALGQTGHHVFTYTASDQNGDSGTATLDITVAGNTRGVVSADLFVAEEFEITHDRISAAV